MGTARMRTDGNVGQPVPSSERPRGDRPVYGQAVPRSSGPNNAVPNSGGTYYVDPYGWYGYYGAYPYSSYYGYYGASSWYGFSPWGYYPFDPLGGWMYGMSNYAYYMQQASGGPSYTQSIQGSLRLKVKPKEAAVFVDGSYYGHVGDYSGTFKHLELQSGAHRLEIKAEGYESIEVDVRILPGKTITYNGELKPVK